MKNLALVTLVLLSFSSAFADWDNDRDGRGGRRGPGHGGPGYGGGHRNPGPGRGGPGYGGGHGRRGGRDHWRANRYNHRRARWTYYRSAPIRFVIRGTYYDSVYLGTTELNRSWFSDTDYVSTNRCGIRAVGFRVNDANAHIQQVRINFADGSWDFLPVGGSFYEGSSVGPFDVPGYTRCISSIVVTGRSFGGNYGGDYDDPFEDEADLDFFGVR